MPPWLMALGGYSDPRPEGRASLLTLMNRVNATRFGFGPDIIFSIDSAAERAAAISGVTTGIGFVHSS
jgi:hypothetical protein